MAENKMKEVAKLFRVKIDEPFMIKDVSYNPYKLTENGLYDCYDRNHSSMIYQLLTGELEIEKPILTEKEKAYFEGVLRPFKDRIKYIKKLELLDCEYIYLLISLPGQKRGNASSNLPCFEKDTMYKGMKLNKEYTLKELGLFE